MPHKITASPQWPFFARYNNNDYILRHDCSKDIPLRERGHRDRAASLYRMMNPTGKEVVVYKVDQGIINDPSQAKCDYGIYIEDDTLYLIELKGGNLNHALEQIAATIATLLKEQKVAVSKLNVRIVLSKVRVPNMIETRERKLKNLLKRNYGGGTYQRASISLTDTI